MNAATRRKIPRRSRMVLAVPIAGYGHSPFEAIRRRFWKRSATQDAATAS
jgi:hypothetical protein